MRSKATAKTYMLPPGMIYLLILTLGSVLTVPQCLSVPVHTIERCSIKMHSVTDGANLPFQSGHESSA